jgi:hypothetical protein
MATEHLENSQLSGCRLYTGVGVLARSLNCVLGLASHYQELAYLHQAFILILF